MDSSMPSPFQPLTGSEKRALLLGLLPLFGGHTKGQVPKAQLKGPTGLLPSKDCAVSSPVVFGWERPHGGCERRHLGQLVPFVQKGGCRPPGRPWLGHSCFIR